MDIPANSSIVAALFSGEQVFGSTVTYGFANAGMALSSDFPDGRDIASITWQAPQKQFIRDVFDYLSTVVDLTFVETPVAEVATISFANVSDIGGTTLGYALSLGFDNTLIVLEEIEIDFETTTAIHEVGHALGLSHPFDGPSNLPGVITDADPGDFGLNTELTTRMAYTPPSYDAAPGVELLGLGRSLGAIDIAALQLIYGAPTDKALGDTTYGVSGLMDTIWDNGGTDTIDFSAAATQSVVDLRAATLAEDAGGGGYLSYVEQRDSIGLFARGGYTIAFGIEVENGIGGAGDDQLIGNALDNQLSGGAGDDQFFGGAGNDVMIGGDGTDLVFLSGPQQSYTVTLGAQGTSVEDRRGFDGMNTLREVEQVAFDADSTLVFDLATFGGTATLSGAEMQSFVELYVAYFNRAPDAVGLNFWGTAFAGGTSLQEMATLFIDQDETRGTYDAGLSNSDFATVAYDNVLGRVVDADGFNFWVGALDGGSVGRDQFILAILDGARAAAPEGASDAFVAQQAADQAYLSTKTDIGTYFAVTKGMSDVADASAAMALFDGSQNSVANAQAAIDGYYAAALDGDSGAFLLPLVGVIDDPFAFGV